MRVCGGGVVEVYFRLAARFDDDGPGAVREDAIAVSKLVSLMKPGFSGMK